MQLTREQISSLCEQALAMREKAYVPYSRFAVGAGLMTEDGKIYGGCNIENLSFGATNCAERTAIFKAVSEGSTVLRALAIAGGAAGTEPDDYCAPCGICRQVMTEFAGEEFEIFLVRSANDWQRYTMDEILPLQFKQWKVRNKQ